MHSYVHRTEDFGSILFGAFYFSAANFTKYNADRSWENLLKRLFDSPKKNWSHDKEISKIIPQMQAISTKSMTSFSCYTFIVRIHFFCLSPFVFFPLSCNTKVDVMYRKFGRFHFHRNDAHFLVKLHKSPHAEHNHLIAL